MKEKLDKIFSRAAPGWVDALTEQLPTSAIDTPFEIASFCAQLQQECLGLTKFEEGLYYTTPERLVMVWPYRFSIPDIHGIISSGKRNAYEFVRNPEKLANYIYDDANRGEKYKLGNTNIGDGWKYRGMGPSQITGKNNYFSCGNAIGVDLIAQPELLKTPGPGISSAIWFWHAHGLDKFDDDTDVRAETRILNGGDTGLKERQSAFESFLKILSRI